MRRCRLTRALRLLHDTRRILTTPQVCDVVDDVDIAQALIAENAAFAELFRDADLSTPVPTCPVDPPVS